MVKAHVKKRQTRRGVSYHVCWRDPDGRERSKVAYTETEATLMRIAVENGDDPERALPDHTTLGEFLDAWEARWSLGKAPKTLLVAKASRATLEALLPFRLSALTAARVEDEIAAIAQTAPRQAQLSLAHLKKCVRSAQARDHTIDPRILTLTPPRYTQKEIRFLDWPEVERLAAQLEPAVYRIVPIGALSGMRKGELRDLTDKQVDLVEGFVTLRKTKTGKPRRVWLSDAARQLFREQLVARHPNAKGLVFPTRTGNRLDSRFERQYRDAVKAAGLDGATFHSLRHTCASLMIRAGCNPLEVAEQLGHMRGGKPDPTMIWKTYGWLYENATKQAVKRLDALIREPLGKADTA